MIEARLCKAHHCESCTVALKLRMTHDQGGEIMKIIKLFKISLLIAMTFICLPSFAQTVSEDPTEPLRVVKPFSDSTIAANVQKEIDVDPKLTATAISTSSRRGVITLIGSVDNYEQADQAVKIARGVYGVRRVISHIIVKNEVPHGP